MGRAAIIVAALAAWGCGFNHGGLRAGEPSFGSRSVRYLRSVAGSATTASILCAIPLSDQPYRRAMQALHKQARLKADEALINVRVDVATRTYIVFCLQEHTVSADVVSVGSGPRPKPPASVQRCRDRCSRAYWPCAKACTTEACRPRCDAERAKCESACR